MESYTIKGKMIIQDLWKLQIDWDAVIPPEEHKAAKEWMDEIKVVKELQIKRRYFSCKISEVLNAELHVFSDASQKGYGAVCYLRVTTPSDIEVQHVVAKSRVAPIKKKTVPQLELMAAVLGAKMVSKVVEILKEIQISTVLCWCDSEIVLHWIVGKDVADGFVRRRVDAIKEITSGYTWRYVPSKSNPADTVSRGTTMRDLVD